MAAIDEKIQRLYSHAPQYWMILQDFLTLARENQTVIHDDAYLTKQQLKTVLNQLNLCWPNIKVDLASMVDTHLYLPYDDEIVFDTYYLSTVSPLLTNVWDQTFSYPIPSSSKARKYR